MTTLENFDIMLTAVEEDLGASIDVASKDPIPVLASEKREGDTSPLWALKIGESAIVSTQARWVKPLQAVVENLNLDELFSVFGAYELSRVTLPDGVGVWGPSWHYVADGHTFSSQDDDRPVELTRDELLSSVNYEIFWHCQSHKALRGFGILEEDQVVALATVTPKFEGAWEIGMEVAPQAKGRGMGRAVLGAAGRWILKNDRLVMATTAPWNVPSARSLRSVGLKHILTELTTTPGHFRVPPQPLGQPYPGVKLYNHYPDWAMNEQVNSKKMIP